MSTEPNEPSAQRSPTTFIKSTVRVTFWNTFLLIVWATWWGGLCFYAIVVVPISTDLIGSVEQGFITQRVTVWHNVLTGVFLACLIIQAFRKSTRVLWSAAFMLAIIEIGLVAWHWHLTSMMDFDNQSVPGNFYSEHAIYLWITGAEWLLGMLIAMIFVADNTSGICERPPSN